MINKIWMYVQGAETSGDDFEVRLTTVSDMRHDRVVFGLRELSVETR